LIVLYRSIGTCSQIPPAEPGLGSSYLLRRSEEQSEKGRRG